MDGLGHILLFTFLLSGVACSSWSVKMPPNLIALADSCLLIPCLFEVQDDSTHQLQMPAGGVWRKGSQWFTGSTDVFNSSCSNNILGGQILGDLIAKNCTSILDRIPSHFSDQYFFRLETGFKITFGEKVNIDVKVFPEKPQFSPVGTIWEGTPLSLTCRAPAPCPLLPPKLSWTPWLGDDAETLEQNHDGTLSVLSVLNFTASHLHHQQMVTCTASYSLQTDGTSRKAEQSFPLTVLYSPKNTSATVSSSGLAKNGSLATLFCSSDSNPPVENYTWYQQQESKVMLWGTGQNLTFNITATSAGQYYCEAQNQHGTERSSPVHLKLEEQGQLKFGIVLWVVGGLSAFVVTALILHFISCSMLRNQEEFAGSADTKDPSGDDSQLYENMSLGVNSKARANRPQPDCDENIYNNSAIFSMYKSSCCTDESDRNIYANSASTSVPRA